MSRMFPRSNSSFLLSGGNALQSQVSRLREETFLVDAGPGTPRICMEDELIRVPTNKSITRFENKVGYLDKRAGESSSIKNRVLERFFMDIVAGDPVTKQRAAAKFNDLVGAEDAAPGEPTLLLPRRFRQTQAWIELNKIWRTNRKVKGFVVEKLRGGYSVAIGGYIAFLPIRLLLSKRIWNDRFTIESINPKDKSIVVV